MHRAVAHREKTARRRYRPAPGDSELTEHLDGGAPRVERVRPEVERISGVLVRLRASAECMRALEEGDVPPAAREVRRGGEPRESAADDHYVRVAHTHLTNEGAKRLRGREESTQRPRPTVDEESRRRSRAAARLAPSPLGR